LLFCSCLFETKLVIHDCRRISFQFFYILLKHPGNHRFPAPLLPGNVVPRTPPTGEPMVPRAPPTGELRSPNPSFTGHMSHVTRHCDQSRDYVNHRTQQSSIHPLIPISLATHSLTFFILTTFQMREIHQNNHPTGERSSAQ